MKDLIIFLRVVASIVTLGIVIYFFQLYYFFYQDVIKTENSIVRHQFPLLLPNAKEDYVSTWGAFGDFVGGTLNPFISLTLGLISIFLLYKTMKITHETLNVSQNELANSTKALQESLYAQIEMQQTQALQQFDSVFFSTIDHFSKLEEKLNSKLSDNKLINISILDQIYEDVFAIFRRDLKSARETLLRYDILNQYFISLYQILKLIDKKIDKAYSKKIDFYKTDEVKIKELKQEIYESKKTYSNILRSIVSQKIMQLLAINTVLEFDKYRKYLCIFSFFEHMPLFRFKENNEHNDEEIMDLLFLCISYFHDFEVGGVFYSAFDNSKYLKELMCVNVYKILVDKKYVSMSGVFKDFFGDYERVNISLKYTSPQATSGKSGIYYKVTQYAIEFSLGDYIFDGKYEENIYSVVNRYEINKNIVLSKRGFAFSINDLVEIYIENINKEIVVCKTCELNSYEYLEY